MRRIGIASILFVLALLIISPHHTAFAAVFIVNTTDDLDDGICNAAHCSLREAIDAANANLTSSDLIQFNIPGAGPHGITPVPDLPAINSNVMIDGTSEPGYADHPLIELVGSYSANAASLRGIEITGGGSVVRGLAINRFRDGIILRGSGNRIEGNFIGTDVMGLTDLGNDQSGIVTFAPGNLIGGISDAARGGLCLTPCNLISGNQWVGLHITPGADGTRVTGNMIGTDVFGSSKIGNYYRGIFVEHSSNNEIGTTSSGNLISGNGETGGSAGVWITGGSNNRVESNRIGTNGEGSRAVPNYAYGVALEDAYQPAVWRNLISGNVTCGVYATVGSSEYLLQGNLIGTDASGMTAIPNVSCGILALSESRGLIGGTEAWQANLIMGGTDGGVGIEVFGGGPHRGDYLTIQGNTITNNYNGMIVWGAAYVYIGGPSPSAANVIINNRGGINIGNDTSYAIVEGNWIGVKPDGTPAGNWYYGVFIASTKNTIGGTVPGAGNVIAHNSGPGIHVLGNSTVFTQSNRFLANSIHDNAALGIDLSAVSPGWDGVTANDLDDTDEGANRLQNFPVLTSTTTDGSTTTISGTLNSLPTSNFRIEFFANTACDGGGHGEGERYLGFIEVGTNDSGNSVFTATGLPATAPGEFITSTATELGWLDTSEFSACAPVTESASAPVVAAIEDLQEYIDDLAFSGQVVPEVADTLNGTLDRAITQVRKENWHAAIAQMNTFSNQVNRYMKTGQVDLKLGLMLQDSAQQIINVMMSK